MKLSLIVFLSLCCSLSFAEEKKYLAKYYDCLSSTNIISDNLPISTQVQGEKEKKSQKAKVYTQGVNLSIDTDQNGDIRFIHIGDELKYSVEDMEAGLKFGVLKLTAHTIQFINFKNGDGGVLEFGFLKKFGKKENDIEIRPNESLNEHFSKVYGDRWGSYKLYLVKDQVTGAWEIQNANLESVSAIFGIMNIKNKLLVSGITEMLVTKEAPKKKDDSVIVINNGNKTFKCQI